MNIRFIIKQYIKMGVQNLFLPVVYRLSKRKKTDSRRIIFADAHHTELPFSMRCFYEKAVEEGMEAELHLCDYSRGGFLNSLRAMVSFMKSYANAGYVVICDNFLPAASCRKRPETKVVQLWHACGALKKFGYDSTEDIPSFYKGNVLKNCDYVTVSAPWCVPHFASAMGLPKSRIKACGISRTDLYYRKEFLDDVRKRFYREYPQAEGRKVVLWAPTFRGNAGDPTVCGQEAIDRLATQLGEDYFLIKSLHPHMRPKDAPAPTLSAEELLVVADLLITDYSSIMFDYMIFRRPLVLFAPDLEEYEGTRGFYMDYRALPGVLVTDEEELFTAVSKALSQYREEQMEQTFQTYMGACDGGATERIWRLMKEGDAD